MRAPRRVLYVTTSTAVGGAEKTLHLLASSVDRSKFQPVGAVCLKPAGAYAARLRQAGVPVRCLGMGRVPTWPTVAALRSAVAEAKPDLVHAFLYAGSQLSRAVKGLDGGFKLISSPRVTYRTRTKAQLVVDRLLRRWDDLLIAESDASARFFLEELGYPSGKVSVIRNGVDLKTSRFSPEGRAAKRKALGVGDGELLLGCVGRLDRQKGQDVLLRALPKLPGRLVVVGDGPDRPRLQALAAELSLGKHCVFLGEVENAGDWLSAIDLLVHPALWEGTPNVVMEAMAAERPVVASRVDGIGEIIEDGRTGRLVPPDDPDALAAAIRALAEDPAARAALGRAAAEEARRRFDLKAMISAYERAYEKVLA